MKQHYATAYIAFILFICLPFGLVGQTTHQYDFVKILPDRPVSMAVDPQRNTYVAFSGNTIIQYDPRGAIRWQQTFTNLPAITKLATDGAGNLIIASLERSGGNFTVGDSTYKLDRDQYTSYIYKSLIVKVDSSHKLQWARVVLAGNSTISSRLSAEPIDLAIDEQNNIYVKGVYEWYLERGNFLSKITPAGRVVKTITSKLLANTLTLISLGIAGTRHGSVIDLTNIISRSYNYSYGSASDWLIAADADTARKTFRNLIGGILSTPPSYTTNFVETFSTLTTGPTDQLAILSNYSIAEKALDFTPSANIERGQLISLFNGSGAAIRSKRFISRSDSADIRALHSNPSGTLLLGGQYTNDYISIAGLGTDLSTLWSLKIDSPTGHDALLHLQHDANGAVLFAASTSSSLVLGTTTVATSTTAPAYYLAKVAPATLNLTAATQPLCIDSPVSLTLGGRFAAYTESPLIVQLSDNKGSFANPIRIGQINQPKPGSYLSASAVTATISGSVAAGSGYQLRVISEVPYYVGEPVSVTLVRTPSQPVVTQQVDELVSNATVGNQWYASPQEALPGATQVRYTPTRAGSYYVVSTQNGCASAPSALVNYVITATEPAVPFAIIYPNPASDQLQIHWQETSASAQIALYDQSGKLVHQMPRSGNVTLMNVRGIMTGVYTVSLQTTDKAPIIRRVLLR